MSKGIGACMHLALRDENTLFYTYCSYNLNRDGWQEARTREDGEIIISTDALIGPEIHSRIRRMPSGRKRLVEKKIPREISVEELAERGLIQVKNSSGTWQTYESGMDYAAARLVRKLFYEYQMTGKIPDKVSWFC